MSAEPQAIEIISVFTFSKKIQNSIKDKLLLLVWFLSATAFASW